MSGGSAMYHGANYQAAIGAFFATLALAENRNFIPLEIPQTAPPIRIGAEQGLAVDDLAVWFGTSLMAWVQAKASLDASGLPDVIGQMVRHVVHGRDRASGTPLQADDRLLLAVGNAAEWIEVHLRELLRRIDVSRRTKMFLRRSKSPGLSKMPPVAARHQPRLCSKSSPKPAHIT